MGTSKLIPVRSIGRPDWSAWRKAGITMTGSWPSFANSTGRLPQTSPRPPVLAKGTASVVAKRIFTGSFLQEARCGPQNKIAHFYGTGALGRICGDMRLYGRGVINGLRGTAWGAVLREAFGKRIRQLECRCAGINQCEDRLCSFDFGWRSYFFACICRSCRWRHRRMRTYRRAAPQPLYRDPIYDGAADPVVIWNPRVERWWMFYTNRRANVPDLPGVSWVHGTPIGIAESADGGTTWKYVGTAEIESPDVVDR